MTKVKLETLKDQEMYTFLESGIRGGVSMICHRRARANNPDADSDYTPHDPRRPNEYLMYLDANNLYGWSMVQKLPWKDFEWVPDREFMIPICLDPEAEKGYIFEVDLDYPEELHDRHNSYPLAPERKVIDDSFLSPYCLDAKADLMVSDVKVEKLVPNLLPKRKYVVHIRNLQYYITQGMVVTKWYRALRFTQANFMEKFIMFNTNMRKATKSEFEKGLFKLINNSTYGELTFSLVGGEYTAVLLLLL